jgi:hypothetical protein
MNKKKKKGIHRVYKMLIYSHLDNFFIWRFFYLAINYKVKSKRYSSSESSLH